MTICKHWPNPDSNLEHFPVATDPASSFKNGMTQIPSHWELSLHSLSASIVNSLQTPISELTRSVQIPRELLQFKLDSKLKASSLKLTAASGLLGLQEILKAQQIDNMKILLINSTWYCEVIPLNGSTNSICVVHSTILLGTWPGWLKLLWPNPNKCLNSCADVDWGELLQIFIDSPPRFDYWGR